MFSVKFTNVCNQRKSHGDSRRFVFGHSSQPYNPGIFGSAADFRRQLVIVLEGKTEGKKGGMRLMTRRFLVKTILDVILNLRQSGQ